MYPLLGLEIEDEPASPRIQMIGPEGGENGEGRSGESKRNDTIVGSSLLVSGLFLCSWGIASWEVEEYQCCPAHNTGNVVKIVAGIVLVNAGLMYLLGVQD
jgi:hypothetical protein